MPEYGRKLSLREIRQISLDILKDVTEYCEKEGITCYLACGTLLGAIKYKGFIPWDDDIDIMMPRPDYERFISSYHSNRYKVLNPKQGMYFYAKVFDCTTVDIEKGIDYHKYQPIGVNIDVFPLDGIVNDETVIEKRRKRSSFLEMLLRLSNQPVFYRKNKLKAINRIIPRIIGSRKLVSMIENNAKQYDYEKSDYVIRYKDTPNGFTGALKKEIYKESVKKEFEGHLFNVPIGYDEWLKRFYGDNYLTYTPEKEKQISHEKECYRKKESS